MHEKETLQPFANEEHLDWKRSRKFFLLRTFFFSFDHIGKNANAQHFFLQSIINIVIQVIFPNIITYLDRTFKDEQNGLNFKIK